MSFPSIRPSTFLAALALAFGVSHAEDPFLGIIKEIKCVGCKPGWVTLVINDPIETREFELYLKDTDYNKIITPLPGKSIHDKGECFYWMQKPKAAPKPKEDAKAAPKKPAPKAPEEGAAGGDSILPPPTPEEQGVPSSCIRYFKQMN